MAPGRGIRSDKFKGKPPPSDPLSRKQRAQAALAKISETPLRDRAQVAPKTESQRRRIWEQWLIYARESDTDPEQVWIDLCFGTKAAADIIRGFLRSYAMESGEEHVCLSMNEEEEREWIRNVKTGVAIMHVWKNLVMWADETVLQKKRVEDPRNMALWRLTFYDAGASKAVRTGLIYSISLWIRETLVEELELSRNQSFEKVPTTAGDMTLYLDTLWRRADDIRCSPRQRVGTHLGLLLMGLGGFRPETIMGLPLQQVEMAVVRDPSDKTKTKLIAKITIYQNKQSTFSIKRKQDDVVAITLTIVPWPLLCVVSLMVMEALQMNAFEAPFTSLDEILQRPNLEGVDFVPLRWKRELLERPMIDIPYEFFWKTWYRILLVAGVRDPPRPYSMRVGAAGRMHESLEPHLCDYILGHSNGVFRSSYQPVNINKDLPRIAFDGESHFENLDRLYSLIANSSLRRDENAPIYVSRTEMRQWESRKDIRDLRAEYKKLRETVNADDPRAKRIVGRIQGVQRSLKLLTIEEKRQEYFEKVDSLRATGRSIPADLAGNEEPVKSRSNIESSKAAACIGKFLGQRNHAIGTSPHAFVLMGVAYLRGFPRSATDLALEHLDDGCNRKEERGSEPSDAENNQGKEQLLSRCLFGCRTFVNRGNLTRHTHAVHVVKQRDFDQPLECPECAHLGQKSELIDGLLAWSSHVERRHDSLHAPYAPKKETASKLERWKQVTASSKTRACKERFACLLCGLPATVGNGYSRHTNSNHKQGNTLEIFQCVACEQEGSEGLIVSGFDRWLEHTAAVHGRDGQTGHKIHATGTSCEEQRVSPENGRP
ncbi:hypothetical protein GQ607_002359 [Colletotrichum asianum]|uniref:C2H2-type domain-containing protein n=1 Tax=Colletotrichum asianum TaxID=702518 RepID=A0A8H3WQH0_9PEZI|nr:hypothetical protein GQ607_002359 [Colletotrichum asianum]